jgi:hypothetical protein
MPALWQLQRDVETNTKGKVSSVNTIVKAEGPSGRAKIHSEDPKHALSLVHYLRTIGYEAWIEDTVGNEIEEAALKKQIGNQAVKGTA